MTRTRSVRFRNLPRLEALEARDVPSFLPPVEYDVGGPGLAKEAVVADFNSDGRRDVAVTLSSGSAAVFLGDGTGQLGTPAYYSTGAGADGLRAADFNHDGKTDLVAIRSTVVSILLGRGDGTFRSPQQFPVGATGAGRVAVGDINGDGHLDLATANLGNGGNIPDSVSTLLGNGNGTFQAPGYYPIGVGGAMDVEIGDLDNDGLGDVSVDGYWGDNVRVFYGDGTDINYVNSACCYGHIHSDVNRDNQLDLVFGNVGQPTVGVMLNPGDGNLSTPQYYTAGASVFSAYPVAADFNRDRRPDVAVNAGGAQLSVLLGNGDGTFAPHQNFPSDHGTDIILSVGNLNNDRYADVVAVDRNDHFVYVILNDTVWAPPIPPAPGPGHEGTKVQAALPTEAQLDPRINAEELTIEPMTRSTSAIPLRRTSASTRMLDVDPAFALLDDNLT